MTRKETIQVLALLQSAFPNTKIDADTTLELWYALYNGVDFEVVKKATEHIIRTSKYFPNHRDFGEAIRRIEYLESIPKKEVKNLPAPKETTEEFLALIDSIWKED